MEEYFNGLLKEVDQRMATTAPGMDGKEVIGVCREMVSYLKGKNRELKEYALAHPFAGDAKEILYFKYYKPALTGRLLYYYRVYQIESGCPACLRVAEPYYRKAMERAERMDGTLPALLPVLPQRGDVPGQLLFPAGEGRAKPRERQLRAGRGGGVLHGLRHTGGTADLGGDAAGTPEPPDGACGAGDGDGSRAGEGTPLDEHEGCRHTARLWHTRDGKRGRGQRRDRRAGCAVREAFPRGSGQRVPRFRQAAGATEPDGVLGRDEGEAAEKDAGHG